MLVAKRTDGRPESQGPRATIVVAVRRQGQGTGICLDIIGQGIKETQVDVLSLAFEVLLCLFAHIPMV